MNFNHIDKHIEITQSGDNNVQNNIFSSQPTQLKGNPFTPPKPREGGLFGREKELEKLHQLLQGGKNVCVVSGMGGVGKTGLVREYANLTECTSFFKGGVYYIDARDRQNMAAEIIALTKWRFKADLPANLSTQQMVTACWQQWKYQTEKVLLILDDVSGLAENIKTYLPPKDLVSLRVLMTSRETLNKRIAEKLELKVLSEPAAVKLLAAIIGQERIDAELEQAKLLCYELGYLPLALELVAYYLDDEDYQDLSLLSMRGKLQEKVKHPALSPEQVPGGIEAQRGLQAAFDLSWDELKPEAKHLACVFGAFAPSPICWVFVTAIYNRLQEESFSPDDLKDRWLKSLRKLNLIILAEKDIYNLHLLVSEYFSEQLKKHPDHSQIKQAFFEVLAGDVQNLDLSGNLTTFNLIEPHLKKVIVWCDNNEKTQFADSGKYELIPNLKDPVLQGAFSDISQLAYDFKFSVILNKLALLYQSQGEYNEAEILYRRSLEISERQLGVPYLHIASSFNNLASNLNNLAALYNSQGRYIEAEPLAVRSGEISERLGVDNPFVATSFSTLAGIYNSQGRYSEAESLFVRSLEIREEQLGVDHLDVATSLNNLAIFYTEQKRYGEAEPLFVRAIKIKKHQLGVDHLHLASTLSGLAELYREQGKYKQAEPLYLQAREICESKLRPDHPLIATSLNNLAVLYFCQRRYGESESHYVKAIEISERQLGTDHPNVASSFNNLAGLYEAQGKYSEAEDLAQQALAIYQNKLGNEHPKTQTVAVTVKSLHIQNLLLCSKETLINIVQALTQQANLPALNTETALTLLEMIESNPELLSSIRESLQQQTEVSDGNT